MIILVPDEAISKREELIARARVRPELYVTSGHWLALVEADEEDEWVVFDRPYGVLELEQSKLHARLLDLEQGVERTVMREHLELAMSFKIILKAF